ncbi:synapsin-1-like [Choloepus didactylus]|uniref:synapsin-1-like n=1 Tax=Choloepus didactylus TaxID=27675 RepID=UPI00189CA2CF|nr:synapsin-1-like [Choloepus didactylus]
MEQPGTAPPRETPLPPDRTGAVAKVPRVAARGGERGKRDSRDLDSANGRRGRGRRGAELVGGDGAGSTPFPLPSTRRAAPRGRALRNAGPGLIKGAGRGARSTPQRTPPRAVPCACAARAAPRPRPGCPRRHRRCT